MDEIYSDIGTDKNYCWTEPDAETKRQLTSVEQELFTDEKNCINLWEASGASLMIAVTAVAYYIW
mgnify:CR=1 FL=1|tara:strand:- start:64 stop:258 length:195 start_codon:yes stop_codon:yes gene_type:complete